LPVGNDVVDLRDPANLSVAIHGRFDSRVFADHERRVLAVAVTDEERHRLRWTLWAAKESALKCLRQVDPDLPFHPPEFLVTIESASRAAVVHRGVELDLVLDVTDARVHVVAVGPGGSDPAAVYRAARVEPGTAVSAPEMSRRVRKLAAREIGHLLGQPAGSIEVGNGTRLAPPSARRNGRTLPVELSLSHDGSWIGCAIRPLLHSTD